jgi:hypothetical protein
MSEFDLLRLHEVRDAYRLIGECRDLGSDPALWQPRLMEGMRQLFGLPWATGGEGMWGGLNGLEPLSAYASGFDESGLAIFRRWQREIGVASCPIFHAIRKLPDPFVVRSRSQLVSDREWYRSASFLHRAPVGCDHQLISLRRTKTGRFHRPVRESCKGGARFF